MYYHVDIPYKPSPEESLPPKNHTLLLLCSGALIFFLGILSGSLFMYLALRSTTQSAAFTNGNALAAKMAPDLEASKTQIDAGNSVIPTISLHINPVANFSDAAVNALTQSRDLKRKSDLTSLATTMNVLLMETDGDITQSVPKTPTHIGTEPGLFNLAKIAVPQYLDTVPKDPQGGTDEDTGYAISLNPDGRFVLQAQSEANPSQLLEVIR